MFLANGVGVGAWAATLPLFRLSLGLSGTELGAALLWLAAGAMIAMPFTGRLIQRVGSRRSVWIGASAWSITFALPGLATGLPALIAAAVLLGAANGVLDVSMNTHAAAVERDEERAIMSSFHAAFSFGGLVGASLGGLLITFFAWPFACLIIAAGVCALVLAGAALCGVGEHAAQALHGRARFGRALVAIGLLAFLSMLVEGGVADWAGIYMAAVARTSLGFAASAFAGFSLAMALGRLVGDRFVRRFGPIFVLRGGALLCFAGIAAAIAVPWRYPALAGFTAAGFGIANVIPVLFTAAGRVQPQTGVAGAATIGYAGFLIGPPCIGALADALGLRVALGVLVAAGLLIAVFAPVVRPRSTA